MEEVNVQQTWLGGRVDGGMEGWVWESSPGLAVWWVGSPLYGIGSVPCLLGETCGAVKGWGEAGLVSEAVFQPARRGLHLPFCPMKGFVIWPGVGVLPVSPLALPVVPQLKKLSSGGTAVHPPPPKLAPVLHNLFVPTSLFCNQGGKKKEKRLFSFFPISRDQQKTRCLVEVVVND